MKTNFIILILALILNLNSSHAFSKTKAIDSCTIIPRIDNAELNKHLEEMTSKFSDANQNNGFQLAIIHKEDTSFFSILNIMKDNLSFLPKEKEVPSGDRWKESFCNGKTQSFDSKKQFLSHTNKDGNTILHLAAYSGNPEYVSGLLDLNLDEELFQQKNKEGMAPVHIAVKNGYIDIANLFFQKMSSQYDTKEVSCKDFSSFGFHYSPHFLLLRDSDSKTVLDFAMVNNDKDMLQLIHFYIHPISERCKMPVKRFSIYHNQLEFILKEAKEFLHSKKIRPVEMDEHYLFEDLGGMHYLSKEEQNEHRLLGIDGILYSKSNPMKTALSCFPDFIYVLSEKDELFVGCPEMGRMHHSSFMSGEDLIGAGHLEIENGKIKSISSGSGHYRPKTYHLIQTVMKLYDRGLVDEHTKLNFSSTGISIKFGQLLEKLNEQGKTLSDSCKSDVIDSNEIFDWNPIKEQEVCPLHEKLED